jgi:hypothetical protein
MAEGQLELAQENVGAGQFRRVGVGGSPGQHMQIQAQ